MLGDGADEALYEFSLASWEEHFELREALGVAGGEVQRDIGDGVEGVGVGLARDED